MANAYNSIAITNLLIDRRKCECLKRHLPQQIIRVTSENELAKIELLIVDDVHLILSATLRTVRR